MESVLSVTPTVLLSDEVRIIFQWIFYSVVSQFIAVFGVVANIINIICFIKQGFQDVANISLLGLSISDLLSLIPMIWANICLTPAFSELDLPFELMEIQYLTGSGPHVAITRLTGNITALIAIERCLCVALPLKVKTIITNKRITSIVVIYYIFAVSFTIPVYYVTVFAEKFSPRRNKTVIGLVFTEDREVAELVVFVFTGCFMQTVDFLSVVVCTILLILKLNSTTKWRLSSTTQGHDEISKRDVKVIKMVITISILFIVSFFPVGLFLVAMTFESEFSIEGRYRNLFFSIFGLCFVVQAINSSANIFIYYHMSSKYAATFRQLFKCRSS